MPAAQAIQVSNDTNEMGEAAARLDTLKVLAMSIQPGEECIAESIEARAKRTWYSDHLTNDPNQVYVRGPALEMLLAMVMPQDHYTGDGFYVWGFASRAAAVNFTSAVRTFPDLSFWQVGLSGRYAVAAEVPLLSYITMPHEGVFFNTQRDAERTERMRVLAHEVFRDFPLRANMSAIIFLDHSERDQGTLPKPDNRRISVLDTKLSKPIAGGLKFRPTQRHRILQVEDEGVLHLYLFDKHDVARTFFAKLAKRNGSTIWHFGKYL